MAEETELRVARANLDVHGTLVSPITEQFRTFIANPVDLSFISKAQKTAQTNPTKEFFVPNMQFVLGTTEPFLVTLETLREGSEDEDDLFKNHEDLTQDKIDECRKLSEEYGVKLTITSGIFFSKRVRLMTLLDKIVPYLDPELMAILRPNNKVGGGDLKVATNVIRQPYECLFPIEDDNYAINAIAGATRRTVFGVITGEQAESQLHLKPTVYDPFEIERYTQYGVPFVRMHEYIKPRHILSAIN
jgi:hypothetical protein